MRKTNHWSAGPGRGRCCAGSGRRRRSSSRYRPRAETRSLMSIAHLDELEGAAGATSEEAFRAEHAARTVVSPADRAPSGGTQGHFSGTPAAIGYLRSQARPPEPRAGDGGRKATSTPLSERPIRTAP